MAQAYCRFPGMKIRRARMVHRTGPDPSICFVRTQADSAYSGEGTLEFVQGGATYQFTGCRVDPEASSVEYRDEHGFLGWSHKIEDRRWRWREIRISLEANIVRNGRQFNRKTAAELLAQVFGLVGETADVSLVPASFYPEVVANDLPASEVLRQILAGSFCTLCPTATNTFKVYPLGSGEVPGTANSKHKALSFGASSPSKVTLDLLPTVFEFPIFMEPVVPADEKWNHLTDVEAQKYGRKIMTMREVAAGNNSHFDFKGMIEGYDINPFFNPQIWSYDASAGRMTYEHCFRMFRPCVTHDHLENNRSWYTNENGLGIYAPTYDVPITSHEQIVLHDRLVDGMRPFMFGRFYGSSGGIMAVPAFAEFSYAPYREIEIDKELNLAITQHPLFLPLDRIPAPWVGTTPNASEGTGNVTEPVLWMVTSYGIKDSLGKLVRRSYERLIGGSGPELKVQGTMAHVLRRGLSGGNLQDKLTYTNEADCDAYATAILDAMVSQFQAVAKIDLSIQGIHPHMPNGNVRHSEWYVDANRTSHTRFSTVEAEIL